MRLRGAWKLTAVGATATFVAGCAAAGQVGPTGPGGDVTASRTALAALDTAGQPHRAGYGRDRFGTPWADVDGNGCDTRNDVLRRDLTGETVASDGCKVLTGRLDDPYTGETIRFRRGPHSADVQIDHIYSLHRAWLYGAWRWNEERREAFANDRRNLLAVDGPANAAKGDDGPAEWLPPSDGYLCRYAAGYIRVATVHDLPVTAADRAALDRMLSRGDC